MSWHVEAAMRSPFPGMDPFLEDPGGWAGAHDALIAIMRELLNGQLGPDFIADGGTSVYILAPDERRWISPDVFVIETPIAAASPSRRGAIATPIRVAVAAPEAIEQPHIVIRDRASRQVIAVLELLSPINKVPEGASVGRQSSPRADFLRKRRETMQSQTHWLEIDLLRAGERPEEARGHGDYYALLRRVGSDEAEVWPIDLRDPLPTIGVPLSPGYDDVALDLQLALDLLFERYRYAELLDYAAPPPAPPFVPADARWIAEQVRQWQAARARSGPMA
jgi:hypothetical protein